MCITRKLRTNNITRLPDRVEVKWFSCDAFLETTALSLLIIRIEWWFRWSNVEDAERFCVNLRRCRSSASSRMLRNTKGTARWRRWTAIAVGDDPLRMIRSICCHSQIMVIEQQLMIAELHIVGCLCSLERRFNKMATQLIKINAFGKQLLVFIAEPQAELH